MFKKKKNETLSEEGKKDFNKTRQMTSGKQKCREAKVKEIYLFQ